MSDVERGALMVLAGRIAWRDLKDPKRARGYFVKVQQVLPANPELQEFVAQHGQVGAAREIGH